MNAVDIIAKDVKAKGGDPKEYLSNLDKAVKAKKAHVLQFKDSVLLILSAGAADVEFHLFSADKPMAVMQAIKYFIKMMQGLPFRRAYTPSATPQILRALQIAGVDVQRSDRKGYRWMADLKG